MTVQRLGPRDLARIAVGGALGTGLRMLLATGAATLLLVNVLGAAALGALHGHLYGRGGGRLGGADETHPDDPAVLRQRRLQMLVGTGLLGGLTTFSTMVVVAGRLGHDAGLVVAGTSRMSGAGLALALAYLAASVLSGLAVFLAARGLARRFAPPDDVTRGTRSLP
jgi:CrcB protein